MTKLAVVATTLAFALSAGPAHAFDTSSDATPECGGGEKGKKKEKPKPGGDQGGEKKPTLPA